MPNKNGIKPNYFSDQQLVTAVVNGSEDAVMYLLLDLCGSRLKYLSTVKFRFLQLEYEEVVSMVYLRLRHDDWKALRCFRGNTCKIENYISLIASRLLVKKYVEQKKENDRITPLYDLESLEIEVDDTMLREQQEMFVELIKRLKDPMDRELLFQYKLEQKSVQEVAGRLNISVGNVYTRCSRAMQELQGILNRELEGSHHAKMS